MTTTRKFAALILFALPTATLSGGFTTGQDPSAVTPLTFTVSTCQEFKLRDDPENGLNEFGCGSASDAHAQGFSEKQRQPSQKFLRIEGGFVSVKIEPDKTTRTHHDVHGKQVHETVIPAP